MRLQCYLVVIVVAFLRDTVLCTVELQPQGDEFICPSTHISRTLHCNVTGDTLRWDVSVKKMTPENVFFTTRIQSSNLASNTDGIVATFISGSSNLISSRVDIPPDIQNIMPITIECKTDNDPGVGYSLRYKESPDPPTNVILKKNTAMDTNYIIHWQPPTNGDSKAVDSYNVTITPTSSPSLPQTFTTNTQNLSVQLNHSTNYTVSLRASNCAGDSTDTVYDIYKDEAILETTVTSVTTADTMTTTQPTTLTVEPTQVTLGDMVKGTSERITFGNELTTTSTNLSSGGDSLIDSHTLTWIVVAAAGLVVLATLVAIVMAILVCYRRKSHLKSVSMETASESTDQSNSANEDTYNKLKAFDKEKLQKQFHNPNYSELELSPSALEEFSHRDPIYHVLEGPDPSTKVHQDQVYAEVSDKKSPDQWYATRTPAQDVKLQAAPDGHHSTAQTGHYPSSDELEAETWNFSYH